ncbi:hypothetical protein OH77DRAFT_617268 [Trametes cingulata]|nr:hypothetical protein OH77DRAFT_617268 [Trametes cingulata]
MPKSKKSKGVSRVACRALVESATSIGSSASTISRKRMNQADMAQEREDSQKRLKNAMSGLGGRVREQLRELHPQDAPGEAAFDDVEHSYQDLQDMEHEMQVEDDLPGEEDIVHALRDFMGDRWQAPRSRSARTWRQRLQSADANWQEHLAALVPAYLKWCYPSPSNAPHSD